MKLWNRFKYLLLKWLLDDICCKSGKWCEMCHMNRREHVYRNGTSTCVCSENFVFKQARKVWKLEEQNEH